MIRQKEPRWWQKEADWWRKRTRLMTKKNLPGGKKKGPGYKKKVTWWQRWVKVGQVFSLRNDNDNVDCQKMGPKLERLFILACRSMLRWVITACIELMNEKQFPPFMTQWPWPCVRTNNHFVSCYKGDDIVWPRLVATITKKASSLASIVIRSTLHWLALVHLRTSQKVTRPKPFLTWVNNDEVMVKTPNPKNNHE